LDLRDPYWRDLMEWSLGRPLTEGEIYSSINEQSGMIRYDARRTANLLGGAGASYVKQPDSTFNYKQQPPGGYGELSELDTLFKILNFIRKRGLSSLE